MTKKDSKIEVVTQETQTISSKDQIDPSLLDEKLNLIKFPPKTSEEIELLDHDILTILGTKQMGKSYFVNKEIIPSHKFVVIYDYYGIYDKVKNVVTTFDDLLELIKDKKNFPISYRPPLKHRDFFEAFCGIMHEIGGMHVIIDELSDYISFNSITPNFQSLVVVGANQGIGLTLITTRPQMIHNDIKSRSLKVITFRVVGQTDREYLSRWLKIDENLLLDIDQYHFLFKDFALRKVEYHLPV